MMHIGLEGIKLHAKTAYFDWERKLGVNLIVDVRIQLESTPSNLAESVDYVEVHRILKEESKKEYQLLEELAQVVVKRVLDEESSAKKVEIKIRKPFLPIANYQGNGSVIEYTESR